MKALIAGSVSLVLEARHDLLEARHVLLRLEIGAHHGRSARPITRPRLTRKLLTKVLLGTPRVEERENGSAKTRETES